MMPTPPQAVRPASNADAALAPADFLSPRANAPAASAAAAAPVQQVAPFATTGVDNSSPEAFIRSIAPYAARVSKATGIPAAALIGMAANETGYGKYASHNNLFGIKGMGPAGSFNTPTWEDYGNGAVTINDNFRAYHSPAESFIDFADLVETSPRYKGAVGQTTVEGFVNGLRQGGYMTDPNYVSKISAITTRYSSVIDDSLRAAGATPLSNSQPAQSAPPVQNAASAPAARPGAGVTVPDQLHIGLPTDEAMAACGPVAAMAFAQVYGRNPTPAEAMDLAKQSGWTAAGGMNGISNEKRLLDKMGLPSQLEMGANWDHIRADALQRQPVIVSTPGHYFVIDGFNPSTGAYHVGQSGKVYRGGSDWMTPAQIQALAGAPSGALFTVHPLAAQAQVLPPLQMPSGQREVLPPLPIATGQREVLPPLDLGNTPPPPPVAASPAPPIAASPAPPIAASAAPVMPDEPPPPVTPQDVPPALAPVAIHDVPPPTLAHAEPTPQPVIDTPPPVQPHAGPASTSDAAPLAPPSEATVVQPAPPPDDVAATGGPLVNPAIAAGGVGVGSVGIGAVAVGSQRQQTPPPPPPLPRRRLDDEEPLSDV
ncbi:MAG TPA: glucosaminidase domain-containing protein [Chloroflexota bacterium]